MDNLRSNPEQRLDLVIAGTRDAVMMVESEAYELTEEEMLGAVKFGHEQMQPVIDLIVELAEDAASEPFDFQSPDYSALSARVKTLGEDGLNDPNFGASLKKLESGILRGDIIRGGAR